MDGASRNPALTPALSTGFVSIPTTLIRPSGTFSHSRGRRKTREREKLLPRIGNMAALDWRRFGGSMREWMAGFTANTAGFNVGRA